MVLFRITVALMLVLIAPISLAQESVWESIAADDAAAIKLWAEAGGDIEAHQPDSGHTPLTYAAQGGHTLAVEALLAAGAGADSFTVGGQSAVYLAARNGHRRALEALLAGGADAGAVRLDAHVPLTGAVRSGDRAIVERLIAAGANPSAGSSSGWTPMHQAARDNQPVLIQVLAAAGADVSPFHSGGQSPLMSAAHHGHREAVERLLKLGGDNSGSPRRAMMLALHNRQYEVGLLLAERGAYLGYSDYQASPLKVLTERGEAELLARFIELGAPVPKYATGLRRAAQVGHTECVVLMTTHGTRLSDEHWNEAFEAAVDNSDVRSHIALFRAKSMQAIERSGKPPSEQEQEITALERRVVAFSELMIAAHEGRTEAIAPLIDRVMRDDPWAIDAAEQYAKHEGQIDTIRSMRSYIYKARRIARAGPSNFRAMVAAVEKEDAALLRRLLEGGADPNFGDPSEFGPIELSIRCESPELLAILLEYGHDPNHDPSWNDRSPLAQATQYGTPEMVALLLAAGADPDEGNDGTTPLSFAAGRGELRTIELLLDAGADINRPCSRSFYHMTPLMEAAEQGQTESVALLARRGADLDLKNTKSETAVLIAAAGGHPDVVEQLLQLGATAPEDADALRPKITRRSLRRPDELRALLVAGADPNASVLDDPNDDSPLETILKDYSWKENGDCIPILLEYGADLSQIVGPLLYLSGDQSGDDSLLQILIAAGADINQGDPNRYNGVPPLHMAAIQREWEYFDSLLRAGADVDARNDIGWDVYRSAGSYGLNRTDARRWAVEQARERIERWRSEQADADPSAQQEGGE